MGSAARTVDTRRKAGAEADNAEPAAAERRTSVSMMASRAAGSTACARQLRVEEAARLAQLDSPAETPTHAATLSAHSPLSAGAASPDLIAAHSLA